MVSLVNSMLIAAGKPSLGYINPSLYASLASTSASTRFLRDVTWGSNYCSSSHLMCCGSVGFSCAPGWDAVTGLGSVDFPSFASYYLALASLKSNALAASRASTTNTVNFYYTGKTQSFVLPASAGKVAIRAFGAAGASSSNISCIGHCAFGGLGGSIVSVNTISSTSLSSTQTLTILVGGAAVRSIGGYGGGGTGNPDINPKLEGGGGGGGASFVYIGNATTPIVVAGGGGGAGEDPPHYKMVGGAGGGLIGSQGGADEGYNKSYGGLGGTQASGGSGGFILKGYPFGFAGSKSMGGNGASSTTGGGGGGGFFGGGGGAFTGGGGGSSFSSGSIISNTQGISLGNGLVSISYTTASWMLAAAGQSCDTACATKSLACLSGTYWPLQIPEMAVVVASLSNGPLSCSISQGALSNAAYPEYVPSSKMCFIGGGSGLCSVAADATTSQRLCPCGSKPSPSPTPRPSAVPTHAPSSAKPIAKPTPRPSTTPAPTFNKTRPSPFPTRFPTPVPSVKATATPTTIVSESFAFVMTGPGVNVSTLTRQNSTYVLKKALSASLGIPYSGFGTLTVTPSLTSTFTTSSSSSSSSSAFASESTQDEHASSRSLTTASTSVRITTSILVGATSSSSSSLTPSSLTSKFVATSTLATFLKSVSSGTGLKGLSVPSSSVTAAMLSPTQKPTISPSLKPTAAPISIINLLSGGAGGGSEDLVVPMVVGALAGTCLLCCIFIRYFASKRKPKKGNDEDMEMSNIYPDQESTEKGVPAAGSSSSSSTSPMHKNIVL